MHVVKRLLLVVVGYLVGVIVALISVVILYFVLSSLPGAPSYFGAMALSPLLILIFPPAWLFVLLRRCGPDRAAVAGRRARLPSSFRCGRCGCTACSARRSAPARSSTRARSWSARSRERTGPTSPSWPAAGLAAASPTG